MEPETHAQEQERKAHDARWAKRDAKRAQAVTRANESLAKAVHMIEAERPHHAIAHSLIALLRLALMHEQRDDE